MRFYWNNTGTVEEYVGESDYYNSEDAKSGPGLLKKIRDLDFDISQLDVERFNTLVSEEKANTETDSKMSKMISWLSKRMN